MNPKKLRRILRRCGVVSLVCVLFAFLGFLVLDRAFPFPFAVLERPAAVVVQDRSGEPLRIFLPDDQTWRLPVRYGEIPEEMIRAVVLSEDRWFHRHPGVNPLAIARATVQNLRAGRVVSGASTIPMQLARIVEPKPRTVSAKIVEAFRALQLTWHTDKHEQLEAYLNLAPYGGNIEGIGAAARLYFDKDVATLSTGEIALLTALPRAPSRYDPTRHAESAREARDVVLRRLARSGTVSREDAEAAMRQPVPRVRRPVPFEAPHAARYLRGLYAGENRILSTIDRELQRSAEAIATRRVAALRAQGIGNYAVVVVENQSRALRALVGSAGFFEDQFDGQVNGAVARRSPGSTLKPLLYALALDDGLVVPDSYLLDVPTDFSGYIAENYDGLYRGRVTVREALRFSLNTPAVRLLSRVGLTRFVELLHRGGLATLDRRPQDYGLPLILGAGEVTLLDLTNLYADLAEGGAHRDLSLLVRELDAHPPEHRLVSREAAALVLEIMTETERPDLPQSWKLAREVPAVAWKTGTSYGHRDAWAVGSSSSYTIGVWVGNFDGTPSQGISGSRHAAPLLFELFRAIDSSPFSPVDARPRGLRMSWIELCALSHERPGPFCPRRIRSEVIGSRSRLPSCRYHQRVFVDEETGKVLDARCLGERPHRAEIVELYPAELVAWWRVQGRPVPSRPVVSAACGGAPPIGRPRIVSPDPATAYRLRRDAPLRYQRIALVARTSPHRDSENDELFWYEDGQLVASGTASSEMFLAPSPGTHRVVVVDGRGRSDSVLYTVEN